MAAKQKITTVTLDPRVWYRGRSGAYSALLKKRLANGYRQQCCIGIACTATGISDEVIRDRGGIEDVRVLVGDEPAWFAHMANLNGEHDLYDINDERNPRMTDRERIAKLNSELASKRIPLRFRLKKSRAATKARDAKRAVAPSASAAQK